MPFTAETVRNQHQAKLAEEMNEPQKWQFSRIEHYDDNRLNCCVCGFHTEWMFIIRHSDDPTRELKISSACIDETATWLISINAKTLAETILTEWTLLLEVIREARQ